MSIYRILFVTSLVPGLLLIAALLSQKKNRSANRLLAGLIVAVLYGQFLQVFKISGALLDMPYLIRSATPFTLAAPALVYAYVLYLTRPGFQPSIRFWTISFLPSFAALVWWIGTLLFAHDTDFFRDPSVTLMWERYVRIAVACVVFGVFTFFAHRQFHRFRKDLTMVRSDLQTLRFMWLRILIAAFAMIWAVTVVEVIRGPGARYMPILSPILTFIVLALAYSALRASLIFTAEEVNFFRESTLSAPVSGSDRVLSEEEIKRWKDKLRNVMEKQKPYVNPNLRISDLAQMMSTKAYLLSQAINQSEQTNFFEFVSRYRVEEAKRRLIDSAFRHMNILGIAMESGFNSKSAFNEAFRRIVGESPSVYRSKVAKKDVQT